MKSRVIGILFFLYMTGYLWSAVTYQDIYRILAERHMVPATTGLTESLNAGLVATVDPGARFLDDKNEVEKLQEAESFECSERLPGGTGYIKFKGLEQNAPARLLEALNAWSNEISGGLIIDLRGANGNSAEAVNKISGFYLPGGMPIYNLRNPEGILIHTGKAETSPDGLQIPRPLILLADTNTSGAAEILCGSLKGRDGIVLVGSTTSGRPCLRDILPLGDGRYLFISGRRASWPDNPDGAGVACDLGPASAKIAVGPGKRIGRALSQTERESLDLARRLADDNVLARAMDILMAGTSIMGAIEERGVSNAGNNPGKVGK